MPSRREVLKRLDDPPRTKVAEPAQDSCTARALSDLTESIWGSQRAVVVIQTVCWIVEASHGWHDRTLWICARVVRAVEAGASWRATAAKFDVSPSFVIKLMQRWHRRGTLAADRMGGGKRSTLAAHAERVHALLAAEPDLTSAELRARLAADEIEVSPSTISRFLVASGLTRKKDRARRAGSPGRHRRPRRLARAAAGL